jgi:hypothetical protein
MGLCTHLASKSFFGSKFVTSRRFDSYDPVHAFQPEKALLLRLKVLEHFPLPDRSGGSGEEPLEALHPPGVN